MPRLLLRAAKPETPLGYSRRNSQIRSPLVASTAWMLAPGAYKYMTPRYTIGVDSCVPFGRPRDHAMRSWPTLLLLIWSSGLKRWSSKVRLIISQSAGFGLASTDGVTGTNACASAEGA